MRSLNDDRQPVDRDCTEFLKSTTVECRKPSKLHFENTLNITCSKSNPPVNYQTLKKEILSRILA